MEKQHKWNKQQKIANYKKYFLRDICVVKMKLNFLLTKDYQAQ